MTGHDQMEWEDRLGQSFEEAERQTKAQRSVRFSEAPPPVLEVWSRHEYDRRGEFNTDLARAEWDQEEEAEKLRQLEDRWQYFESFLPPGQKHEERLQFEMLKAEHERRQREAEDQARERRAAHKKKLMEARAARQKARASEDRIAAVSQPDEVDEDSEDSRRLALTAESRASAPPPPAPGGAGGASNDRAERLRRLAEQRRKTAEAPGAPTDASYLDQAQLVGSRSATPDDAALDAINGEAIAKATLPVDSPAESPAPVRRPSHQQQQQQPDARNVLNAVDQAISLLEQRIQT